MYFYSGVLQQAAEVHIGTSSKNSNDFQKKKITILLKLTSNMTSVLCYYWVTEVAVYSAVLGR